MALSGYVDTGSYEGRYLRLNWSAKQDIATNKSTISWSLVGAGDAYSSFYYCGNFKVTIAGTVVYEKGSDYRIKVYKGTSIANGTITLSHNADGTKSFSAAVTAGIYTYARNKSGSNSFTLNQIPRAATISSADAFDDEGNPVLKYSNPAGTALTLLQACIANTDGSVIYVPYRDISKSGTEYTFNLTDTERDTLRQACVNAPTMEVKFYVKSEIGGQTYTKNLQKTFSIVNAEPTGSITISASDTQTEALMGTASAVIKGISDLAYTVTSSAKKFATIKSIQVTNGNDVKTTATGTFTDAQSNTTTVVITDSRGFTKTINSVISSVVNYINPTASLSYSGVSVEGTVNLDMSGQCYGGKFGNNTNNIVVSYRVREVGGSFGSYITIDSTVSNNTYTASTTATGLDYKKVYEIEYRVRDSVKAVTSNMVTIHFLPKFDWGENDFNFNVPVFIQGQPLDDYIIEEGTVDGWNYRKWNRGVMEAWYAENITTAVSTAYGNGFYNGGTPYVDIPSGMFTNIPHVFLSIEPSNAQIYSANIAALSNTRVTYYISSMKSQTSSQMRLQIYAYGLTEV